MLELVGFLVGLAVTVVVAYLVIKSTNLRLY